MERRRERDDMAVLVRIERERGEQEREKKSVCLHW